MALSNVAEFAGNVSACGAASPEEKPSACGAAAPEEKPSACGSACGAGDK
ncbi:MAG: ACGX-repeat peptide [Lachnospiraceae bacterium]|nr:ACGX-repeat peptide [Lachnospiraceae bacterium]